MPFQKNHQYRWEPKKGYPLDKNPICFKGRIGQKDALKDVPDWQNKLRDYQNKLRDYIDELTNKKPS